jgi:hypothetical protein
MEATHKESKQSSAYNELAFISGIAESSQEPMQRPSVRDRESLG